MLNALLSDTNLIFLYGEAGINCLLYTISAVLGKIYVNRTSHDRERYRLKAIYSNWPVNKFSKQQGEDLDIGKAVCPRRSVSGFSLISFI